MVRMTRFKLQLVKEESRLYNLDKSIKSPAIAQEIINTVLELNNEHVEKFGFLALDVKNKVIGIHIIHIGSLTESMVHPREVFKAAILNNSASVIVFHNHPSGDPTPSKDDIAITRRLVEAGRIIGIGVIDHIIVGDDKFISMMEQGLM